MAKLTFEDFTPGRIFRSGDAEMTASAIVAFARKYDPQPQHLDPDLARRSQFGTLVASGWHTAAVTMRLQLEAGLCEVEGGLVGAGMEKLAWPIPVHPGDRLHAEIEVLDARPSRSKPDRGLVRLRTIARNQNGAIVQEMVATVVAPRRRQEESTS